MKLNCMEAEEEIWDCSRLGLPFPPDVQTHILECKKCAQAAGQAGTGLSVLRAVEQYPPAPDCRQQVLYQIGPKRKAAGWRYAWAFAPVAIAVLLLAVFCQRSPEPYQKQAQVKQPVKQMEAVRQEEPKSRELPVVAAAGGMPSSVNRLEHISQEMKPQKGYTGHKARHTLHVERRVAAAKNETHFHPAVIAHADDNDGRDTRRVDAFKPDDALKTVPVQQERVVQAVSVTWSAEPVGDDVSYQYSETDGDAGVVTTGSVERTGDTIELHMESVPVNQAPLPTKGMIKHENKPSA